MSPLSVLAQVTDPFGAGTPTPTATPIPTADTGTSDTTLLVIAAGVLIVFLAIGWFITRDARRNLTAEDRAAIERGDDGRGDDRPEPVVDPRKKAQRRKKTRAQRQARKANRPRRR